MKHLVAILALAACGTTGGQIVTFDVAAAGNGTTAMDTGLGWHVVLGKATVHLGALYLNLARPISGAQSTSCILPGIYTAEELAGLDVDVLSTAPQLFPVRGTGTDDAAKTAEIWLTGGDVNAANDPTIIADLAGTASKGATTIAWSARVTIGDNRYIASSDPARPSAHPICKQRIVTPIPLGDGLRPVGGGTLLVRVDPTLWFANVDFSELQPPDYAFPDDLSIPASQNLFTGLRASTGTYQLSFQ